MEKDRERKNQKKKNPNRFQLGNDLRCGRSRSLRIFRVVSDTREYVENRGGRVRWRGSGGPMVTRDSGRLFHNNISRFVGFFFFFFGFISDNRCVLPLTAGEVESGVRFRLFHEDPTQYNIITI